MLGALQQNMAMRGAAGMAMQQQPNMLLQQQNLALQNMAIQQQRAAMLQGMQNGGLNMAPVQQGEELKVIYNSRIIPNLAL